MTQTLGQKIIRTSFNPSKDSKVDEIKQLCADLYDKIHSIQFIEGENLFDPEVCRCVDKAQDFVEDAAVYAVKALTVPKEA
jgi:hypothetical protein